MSDVPSYDEMLHELGDENRKLRKEVDALREQVKAYKQGVELQAGFDWHNLYVEALSRIRAASELVEQMWKEFPSIDPVEYDTSETEAYKDWSRKVSGWIKKYKPLSFTVLRGETE